MSRGVSGWAALGIAVLVVFAAAGIYHVVDVRNDLQTAIRSEYGAVDLYTRLGAGNKNALSAMLGQKNSAYTEILTDEEDHIARLDKYVNDGKVNTTYPVTVEGAIQSEKDAIAQYQELLNEVYLHRGLKEDLQHILDDEEAHLEILEGSVKQKGINISQLLEG
jgi:glutaredoxin